jgi:myo-inositol-1(or 4)-monophosphatase
MKSLNKTKAIVCAVNAAKAAGKLMRANWHLPKRVNAVDAHDIKLELDVRCQKLIEKTLRAAFPQISVLGEEGCSGNANSEYRWVVDPIDGTVNYFFGIPHAAVSIALQQRVEGHKRSHVTRHALASAKSDEAGSHVTLLGVIYDPFTDELWTATRGGPARLNGKIIHVSRRSRLEESVIAIGFSKSRKSLEQSLPHLNRLARRARKIRILGSAALELAYVASGRLDAYIERSIHLWDIAAGGLILECAGGKFWVERIAPGKKLRLMASNGLIHRKLPVPR